MILLFVVSFAEFRDQGVSTYHLYSVYATAEIAVAAVPQPLPGDPRRSGPWCFQPRGPGAGELAVAEDVQRKVDVAQGGLLAAAFGILYNGKVAFFQHLQGNTNAADKVQLGGSSEKSGISIGSTPSE